MHWRREPVVFLDIGAEYTRVEVSSAFYHLRFLLSAVVEGGRITPVAPELWSRLFPHIPLPFAVLEVYCYIDIEYYGESHPTLAPFLAFLIRPPR